MSLFTDGRRWYRLPDKPLPAGELRLADTSGRVMNVDADAVQPFVLSDAEGLQQLMALLGTSEEGLVQQVLERVRGSVEVEAPAGDDIASIEAAAHQLLSRFPSLSRFQAASVSTAVLQPRPGDIEATFGPGFRQAAEEGYTRIWQEVPIPTAKPGQTETRVLACTVAELRAGTDKAADFPGGYARVLEHLVDGPVWVRWRYTEPGRSAGMAYDGLVWLGDHWAWFPKPWRLL